MKIDCLPVQGRAGVLSVRCDGEHWRNVHTSIFGRIPRLPKESTSLSQFAQEFAEIEYQQARQYVIRRLSAQSYLSVSLARLLKQKSVSESIVERLIDEMTRAGFLKDEEWIASYVRVQTARKSGPRAIAAKLAVKGVDREQIQEFVESNSDRTSQKNTVSQLIKQKYKNRNLGDFRERQKVMGALMRKGFDFDVIMDCFKQFEE